MGTIAGDYNRQHSVNRRKSPAIAGDHAEAYRRVMSTWPSMMVGTAEGDLPKLFSLNKGDSSLIFIQRHRLNYFNHTHAHACKRARKVAKTCTRARKHAHMHARARIRASARTRASAHKQAHTRAQASTRTHAYAHARMHAHTRWRARTRARVCACMRARVCVRVLACARMCACACARALARVLVARVCVCVIKVV